jgi:hypothetical protein
LCTDQYGNTIAPSHDRLLMFDVIGRPTPQHARVLESNWRETRTGFTGPGLPAAHQDVGGIPSSKPISATTPLFMGFKSNLKHNQATEADVAIASGAFADGTTMHVSQMRLRLARSFSAGTSTPSTAVRRACTSCLCSAASPTSSPRAPR